MAVDRSASIKVQGLAQFRTELRALSVAGPVVLKDANWRTAQFVADAATTRAAGVGRQAAKAATSLQPSRAAVAARITGGSAAIPWFFGAEFGSNRYHQFKPHLGRTGYFLYPTIRDKYDEILDFYGDELMRAASLAFPDGV